MPFLSSAEKYAIKKRRGFRCNRDGKVHKPRSLVIHHKDRDPENNDPRNLRVLCRKHHNDLHRRAGY